MDYAESIQGRITINRIDRLTPTDFHEVAVRTIDPYFGTAFPDKIHTLCGVGDVTLVDGCREAFILRSRTLCLFQARQIARKIRGQFRKTGSRRKLTG